MFINNTTHPPHGMIDRKEKILRRPVSLLGSVFLSLWAGFPISAYSDTGIIALSQYTQAAPTQRTAAQATQQATAPFPASAVHNGLAGQIDAAMVAVSRLYHIPLGLLHAISLTESGIGNQPWPWTLNVYGVPYRFSSAQQTRAAVRAFLDRGIQLVDIGPMQVDWQYHQNQLGSVTAAVNPLRNVAVAGRILKTDYDQTGNWRAAVGLYHGGGPQRQNTYIQEVFSRWHRTNSAVDGYPEIGTFQSVRSRPVFTTTGAARQPADSIVALVGPRTAPSATHS